MPVLYINFFIILSVATFFFSSKTAQAQSTTMGTEFWLGFMENNGGSTPISVFISSPVATTGTVSIPGLAWSQNFVVAANTTTQVNIPAAAEIVGQSGVILNRAIRVTANSPVYVYANSEKTGSSDATLILPKHLLGLDYIILTHSTVENSWNKSEFMIVATENNTQVEIIPSVATQNGWPANIPQIVTLNQGQLMQIQAAGSGDLTGTRVRAAGSACGNSPPFAVFAGNVCVNIGGCTYCDHIFEQMFPVTKFGSQYITVPLLNRTGGDFIKIMAIADNTTIQVNGNPVTTLNCRQTHTLSGNITTQACYITANRPIAVAQFSRGQSCDNTNYSDPFFILLSPIEVMPNTNVTISGMNLTSYWGHRVNIVTATANTANVSCTCGPLAWAPVPGNPAFSIARRSIGAGNSTITSTGTGFYATVYGWGDTESATSYGYAGGGALIDLAFQIEAPNQVCQGSNVNFSTQSSLPITQVTWNFGDGSAPVVSNNPSHTYTQCGTYTVTATVGTNLSCGNLANTNLFCVTKIIEVIPKPTASLGNIQGICQGGNGQIPININNASCGNRNYTWNLNYTINNNQPHSRSGSGNLSITLPFNNLNDNITISLDNIGITTNEISCSSSINQSGTLVVSPPPSAEFNTTLTALCLGAINNIQPLQTFPPNTSFSWNFDGGIPATANTPGPHQVSWSSPGIKTIQFRVTAPGCSPSISTQVITVFPIPTSTFEVSNNFICENQLTTLTFTGTTQGNATFIWNIPEQAGNFTTSGPFSLQWNQAGIKTITLQTIENGCSSSITTILITVNPNPIANFTSEPPSLCLSSSTRITYTGSPNATIYTWHCDNCLQAPLVGLGPHTLSWNTAGTKALRLQVATSAGCISEVFTQSLEVYPLPAAPTATLQHRCGPGSITFSANSPNGTLVRLFSSNSGGTPLQVATDIPYTLTTPPLQTTTTFFLESAFISTGCSSTTRTPIVAVVEPLPATPTATPVSRCGPGMITITASIGNPPANIVRLYTQPSGGTSIQTDNSPPFNFVLNPLPVTTTYYLEAENSITGCISPSREQVILTIHPIPATPQIPPLERCGAGNITFTPILTQPAGQQVNIYTVPLGGSPRLISTTPPFEFTTFPLTQTTTLYAEYINTQTGCTSSRASFVITIKPLPSPPVQNSMERCGVGVFTFNPIVLAGNKIRIYQPQNTLIAEIEEPYTYSTPPLQTTTTYYLTTFNSQTGCESPATEVIAKINPQAKNPVLTSNAPVCLGEDMNIVATIQLDGVFYTWKRPGGKPDTTTQSPILWIHNTTYADTGTYTVFPWTPQGCNAPPTSIRVGIKELPLTPNVTFYNVFRQSIPLCEGQEINLAVLNYPDYPEGTIFNWEGPNNFRHSPHPFPGVDTARIISQGWYYVKAIHNGCTSKVGGVFVPVYPRPLKPVALNNSPICANSQNSLILSVGSTLEPDLQFEWIGPNNFWARGAVVERPALHENAGIYTLVAITPYGCRSQMATTTVTFVHSTTDLQFEAPATICAGQTLQLKARAIPGATYYWNGPNNFSATTLINEISIFQVSASQTGLYSLSIVLNGCSSPTSTRTVRVIPLPAKPIVIGTSTLCEGSNLVLTVSNPPDNGIIRLQGPNFVDFQTANPQLIINNVNSAAAGVYRITTLADGCTSAITEVDITILSRPMVSAQFAPLHPCVGDSLLLFAQSMPGAQFHWSGPNGFVATTASASRSNLSLLDAGSYQVYAIFNGCTSNTQRLSVNIRSAPQINGVRSESEVCEGASISITATVIPGTIYQWRGPNGFSATGPNLNINSANTQNSGLYTLQAITAGCTSAPFIQPLIVKPLPSTSQFFSNGPLCVGSQLVLTAMNIHPDAEFIITGPNNYSASGKGPYFSRTRVTTNDAGIYRLTTILNGCTGTIQTLNIAIHRIPSQPIIHAPSSVCEGGTLQLSAVAEPGAQFIWQGPAGFFATNNNPSLTAHSTSASGNYTVRAILNGCTSSIAGKFIQVQTTPPTPTIQHNLPLCHGNTLLLSVFSPSNNVTYLWEGPASFIATGTSVSRLLESLEYAGNYSVRAIQEACTSSQATVAVNFGIKPIISAESNSPICEGQQLQLEATLIPEATYEWKGPYNFHSEERNPFRKNASTLMNGAYYVVARVGACTSEPAVVHIQITPTPTPPILSNTLGPFCEGQSISLNASNILPGVSLAWSGPAGFTSEERSPILQNITTTNAGTYAVVAKLGNCISLPAQTQVIIEPTPAIPTILGKSALCTGENLQLSATSSLNAQYQWNGPNGFTSNQTAISIPNVNTHHAGRYAVVARIGNCTSRAAFIEINITPTPPLPRIGSNSPICAGTILHLSTEPIVGARYLWNGPKGFISTQQSPSIQNISLEQSGTYSLVVIMNNCTSSQSITHVNIHPTPSIIPLSIPSSVCIGQSVKLEVQNQNNVQYFWYGPAGYSAQGALQYIHNFQNTQSGNYTLVAVLGNCTTQQVFSIQAIPSFPRMVAGSNSPLCEGQKLILSITQVTGAQYFWSGPAGFQAQSIAPERPSVTPAASGIYSVYAVVGNCTSNIITTSVTVTPLPTSVAIQNNSPVCSGNPIELSISPQANFHYSWLGPNGFSTVGAKVLITNAIPTHAGTYSLTVQNGSCIRTFTTEVIVTSSPQRVFIQAPNAVCEGSNLVLEATSIPNATYFWSGPNGFSATGNPGQNLSITTAAAGTYSLIVIANGCTTQAPPINISVISNQNLEVKANTPLCEGSTLFLSTTPAFANANYWWNGPQNFQSTTPFPSIPNVSPEQAGIYKVIIIQNGCTVGNGSIEVQVKPLPPIRNITSNSPVCAESDIPLQLNIEPIAEAQYLWYGPNGFSSTSRTPQVYNPIGGNYTAVAIVKGCTSVPKTINVQVSPGPGNVSAGNNGPLCSGQILQLTANAMPGSNFEWRGPAGFYSTQQNPIINPVELQNKGTYSLIAILGNCTSKIHTTDVEIYAALPPIKATANGPLCAGQTLQLQATNIPGAIYRWSGPGGFIHFSASPILENIKTEQAGVYSVSVQLGSCTTQIASVTVEVLPTPPTIYAGNNGPACAGSTLSLWATQVSGATYEWRGPEGFISTSNSPILSNAQITQSGIYSLMVRLGSCPAPLATTEVRILPAPLGLTAGTNAPICANETLSLTASTFMGASYKWIGPLGYTSAEQNPTISSTVPEMSGIYSVVASIGNCSAVATVNVEVRNCQACPTPSSLNLRIIDATSVLLSWIPPSTGVVCAIISYGPLNQNPESWQTQIIPAAQSSFQIRGLTPGVEYGFRLRYNCQMCSPTQGNRSEWSRTITHLAARQATVFNKVSFKAFPNPTKNIISIVGPTNSNLTYRWINQQGKDVTAYVSIEPTENEIAEFNLGALSQGIYHLLIYEATNNQILDTISILKVE
ncbi:MAG: PKD domain-containing protein [Bacteroidia bacterium]|nr:PKD domain-containing protein [Bacteroidia bacterium]MDW8159458.1 PKD domain-containing protein [Bacteroidia bacterium]